MALSYTRSLHDFVMNHTDTPYNGPMDNIDFVKAFPLRPFKKGEVLLSEGDAAHRLLAVQTGYIKVSAIEADGSQQLLWIAGRYDVVPVERMFSSRTNLRYFYTALSDGTAYHVDKQTFLDKAADSPALMAEVARGISQHYDELLERLQGAGHLTVRDRLVAVLRYVTEHFSSDVNVDLYELGLRLTHQDLASMIGTTRETVSLALGQLMHDGIVDYSRDHFRVHTDQLP